jgi:hypothetical protein
LAPRQFRLKSTPIIFAAYAASSLAGGCALGIQIVIGELIDDPEFKISNIPDTFIGSSIAGAVGCLVMGWLLVILPIVLLLKKRYWRWLSLSAVAACGFFLFATLTLLIFMLPVEGELDVAMGYFANGLPTASGLTRAASNAVTFGFVGLVSMLVFRAIAVQKIPHDSRTSARAR